MKPTLLIAVTTLALASGALVSCGPADRDVSATSAVEPASPVATTSIEDVVPVVVAPVVHGPVSSWIVASGNLEAVQSVEVLAKVAGQADTQPVEEGTSVAQGDVLVQLDPNEYRLAAARAQAELDKKRADLTRYQEMLDQGVVSRVDFDQAVYDARQSELALEQARIDLKEATVLAPISGVISSREVELGARVSAHQKLFTIVTPDRLWVHVFVPEADLPGLAVGQVASVSSDVLASSYGGTVERIAPIVDPQSGTVKVTVRLASGEQLRPGMFVNVKITTARRDSALLISKRAVVYAGDSTAVYRIDDGTEGPTAHQITVRLGASDAGMVEVVEGLGLGDRVVVLGQDSLREGLPVTLVSADSVGLQAQR